MSVKRELSKRPAGVATLLAVLLVFLASQAGVDITTEEAVAIIGATAAFFSGLFPRHVQ